MRATTNQLKRLKKRQLQEKKSQQVIKISQLNPLEKDECKTFAAWLRLKKLKFGHIPNENTITNMAFCKMLKLMGWEEGLPDYIIRIERYQSKDKKRYLIFVEMKRKKGSITTKAQKEWNIFLNGVSDNVVSFISKGAAPTIEKINKYLKKEVKT